MVCKEQGLPAEVNARSVGASREHKGTMTALLIRRSCMVHTELIRRLKMTKKVNAVARGTSAAATVIVVFELIIFNSSSSLL